MSEKIKIPKLNREFFKNNLLFVVAAVGIALLVCDISTWLAGQKAAEEITQVKQKKEKIKQIKEKLEKISKDKPYLKTEEFSRKIPVSAIPPVAAMQQAGLIIKAAGAQGKITLSEESSGGSSSGSGSGGQAASGSDRIGELIAVGSKSLSKQKFSFKFESNYEDFMEILEKLPLADPLIIIEGFTLERIDTDDKGEPIPGTPFTTIPPVKDDVRKLKIELKLATFTEVLPE